MKNYLCFGNLFLYADRLLVHFFLLYTITQANTMPTACNFSKARLKVTIPNSPSTNHHLFWLIFISRRFHIRGDTYGRNEEKVLSRNKSKKKSSTNNNSIIRFNQHTQTLLCTHTITCILYTITQNIIVYM